MTDTKQILQVRLTPKASRTGVQGWMTDADNMRVLKVAVTAVPEKGKANKALITFLAKSWGIAKSDIEILKGQTDRHKTLAINIEAARFEAACNSIPDV